MIKRKLWSSEEDLALQSLIKSQFNTPNWESISSKLAILNFSKTPKQCKDRWMNNLSPLLNKSKWTSSESQELFKQYLVHGNKWKNISKVFAGRTDNAVKNQFFSVIRKSLRTMNKILGINCNTGMINNIKPKILAELLSSDPHNENKNNLIKKFAFTPYAVLSKENSAIDLEAVAECIRFVIRENDNYINKKIMKSKAKNGSKSITTTRSSVMANSMEVEVVPLGDFIEEVGCLEMNRILSSNQEVMNTNLNQINAVNIQIQDLILNHDSIVNSGTEDFNTQKEKVKNFFAKLTDLSSSIKTQLENSTETEDVSCLNEYLDMASQLIDLFKSKTHSIEEIKPTPIDKSHTSELNKLDYLHNFSVNDECFDKIVDDGDGNPVDLNNSFDIKLVNGFEWDNHPSVSVNHICEPVTDKNSGVCIYEREMKVNYDSDDVCKNTYRFACNALEEMLEEFNYSVSYL